MKRSKAIQIISDAICNYEIEKSLNTGLTIEQASEQLLKELEDLGIQPPEREIQVKASATTWYYIANEWEEE